MKGWSVVLYPLILSRNPSPSSRTGSRPEGGTPSNSSIVPINTSDNPVGTVPYLIGRSTRRSGYQYLGSEFRPGRSVQVSEEEKLEETVLTKSRLRYPLL